MTTSAAPARTTVHALLYGPGLDRRAIEAMEPILRSARTPAASGALPGLSAPGQEAVRAAIAGAVDRALDTDLTSLLVSGWTKLNELRTAARTTIAFPGSTEVVDLLTHTMTLVERPEVEVLVNGTQFGQVEVQITLELVISGLLAVVREGQLVEVRAGKATGAARLTIEGANVTSREVSVDIPGVVRLGRGIELLAADHRPPPPGPPPPPPGP